MLKARGFAVFCAGCRTAPPPAQGGEGEGGGEGQPPWRAPHALDYGSIAYKEFILARTKTVGDILKAGYDVLLADADAVWMSDPFRHFKVGGGEGREVGDGSRGRFKRWYNRRVYE